MRLLTQRSARPGPIDSNYFFPAGFSAADVWSDVIFHPSSNLRNTSVNRPVCGLVAELQDVAAANERGPGIQRLDFRFSKVSLPISFPSDRYRLMYRSRVASQPLVTLSPDVKVSSSLFQ